jgi:hypothetical protein
MINKLKQYNWYKIGFLSVCGMVFLATLYLAYHGALYQSRVFAAQIYGANEKDVRLVQQCAILQSIKTSNALKGLE